MMMTIIKELAEAPPPPSILSGPATPWKSWARYPIASSPPPPSPSPGSDSRFLISVSALQRSTLLSVSVSVFTVAAVEKHSKFKVKISRAITAFPAGCHPSFLLLSPCVCVCGAAIMRTNVAFNLWRMLGGARLKLNPNSNPGFCEWD